MAREPQPFDVEYWTIDQAARHFGFARATVAKYIRDGLPTYVDGRFVKPAEVVAHRLERKQRQRDTRIK